VICRLGSARLVDEAVAPLLIAALEIDGEFLATDGGQIERKQRIVGHAAVMR
jgi:hypothetical protein